jgi:hypothetical protein
MLARVRHPEGALMAEDDPRNGEPPEHGQDPGTTDQPPEPPPTVGSPPPAELPTTASPRAEPGPAGEAAGATAREGGGAGEPEPAPPAEPEPSVEPEPAAGEPTDQGLAETAETQRIERPDDTTAIRPTDPWAEAAPPIEPPDEGPRPVGPSGTTVMPAVPPPSPGPEPPADTPRWSARAQVPQAESHDTMAEGLYEEPPGRGLGTTLLIGGCVVLLLAAIAFGVWLVVRGLQGVTPTPPVEPTQPTATAPPTTAPTKPSPTVTTTTPVAVPVPDLRGQDYTAAANTLTGLGLVPKRVNEPSTTVPAGKVIRTDPSGGFALSGANITVVVSSGSPTPSASSSPSPKKS